MMTIPTVFHSEADLVSDHRRGMCPTRRSWISILLAIIGLFATIDSLQAARAADEDFYQTAGGMAVYIGLLPAEIVQGLPTSQPEATMRGAHLPASTNTILS